MKPLIINSYRANFGVATIAALGISCLWFVLTWRYGFDLADEGFYWYGAQRVLLGEVPLRDFMSYDIGRYYWASAFMHFMKNDGLFSIHVSAVVYQAMGTLSGVFICLLALRREGIVRWLFALLAACILTIWVNPYYKAYDHATSIAIVAMLVLMLKTTKPAAWLFAGVCLGVAAIIGRNHGVYGALASFLVLSVLLIKAPSRKAVVGLCGYFVLGVLIGFSPTLIMILTVEGFAAAFKNSIISMVQYGATNIALPVPWPWNVRVGGLGVIGTIITLARGIGFVYLLIFPLIGTVVLAFTRFDLSSDARKVFVAAIATTIPYTHYTFSRADFTHLSLGIFPALIGLLAACGFMKGLRPLVLAFCFLMASLIVCSKNNAYLDNLLNPVLVKTEIAGEQRWLYDDTSEKLQLITKELQEQMNGSSNFLALPNMPSIHAIFRTRMPIWDIYSLFKRDKIFEVEEIKRLESSLPKLILLSDHALDGNPEFRYSRMHPLTYAWITSNYAIYNNNKKLEITTYSLKRQGI